MGGETFKKVLTYSNPVTAAIDIAGQATGKDIAPKISYKGVTMNAANLTSPQTAAMEGASVAGQQDALREQARAEEKLDKAEKSDDAEFAKFKNQETNLLANGNSTELFVPQYKTGKRKAETDALAKIFQARKDEVMARSSRPGVSQTRMGAL